MRIAILFLSAALAAGGSAGCKDKPKQAAPTAGSGSGSDSGSAVASGPGSGSGSASDSQGSEIVLPKLSGTGPVKTAKPLGLADLEKLTKLPELEVESWGREIRHVNEHDLEVRYKTKERPVLAVTINTSHCQGCQPMDLAKWTPLRAQLMESLLALELRTLKDTTFEIGTVELAKTPMISAHQVAYYFGKNDKDEQVGGFSHAYTLYFNDGINQIRVVAQYMDDTPASREDLLALAPKEDLARIALAFMDLYTHKWGTP